MEDEVEKSIREQRKRLLDDTINHNKNFYYDNLSNKTKERVVKEGVIKSLNDLINSLNKEFKDVLFQFSWKSSLGTQSYDGYRLVSDIYNDERCSDENNYDDMFNESENIDAFYETDFCDLNFQLDYIWTKKCSLGHNHRVKRFLIWNIPKVLDLLSFFRFGAPVRTIVKEHIPDFFYDPSEVPPKKARKKG